MHLYYFFTSSPKVFYTLSQSSLSFLHSDTNPRTICMHCLKRNLNSLHIIEHNPESSVPFITGGRSVSFLPTNRGFNCTGSTPGGGGS